MQPCDDQLLIEFESPNCETAKNTMMHILKHLWGWLKKHGTALSPTDFQVQAMIEDVV